MLVYSNVSLNIQESIVYFCVSINEGIVVIVVVPQVVMMMLQQHLEEPHKLELL